MSDKPSRFQTGFSMLHHFCMGRDPSVVFLSYWELRLVPAVKGVGVLCRVRHPPALSLPSPVLSSRHQKPDYVTLSVDTKFTLLKLGTFFLT